MKIKDKSYSTENIKNKDYLHVFLVNNPVTAIVSSMICSKYDLNPKNSIFISLRRTDISIFKAILIYSNDYIIDKIFFKLFNVNLKAKRLIYNIQGFKKKFVLYTSWDYPLSNIILNSRNCIGHNYIEEGQAAYRNLNTYNFNNYSLKQPDNKKIFSIYKKSLFRDNAINFYGISKDAFPKIVNEKRIILNNFDIFKSLYNPQLIGIKYIGLTCASRRILNQDWELMLKNIIKEMPTDKGVIKLHPSFVSDIKLKNEITNIFKRIAPPNISLCSNKIIIELEILCESKIIFGPMTSLEKYTNLFNSKFISIKLY